MKYKTIDHKDLRRFWDIMLTKERECSTYRKDRECNRAVFVRRVLKKFTGKCYAVITEQDTGKQERRFPDCGWDLKPITFPVKLYVYVADINYALGWSEELEFLHCLAHPSKILLFKRLKYNDLLDLKYREIPLKEYKKVQAMFDDDSVKEKKDA